MSEQKFPNIPPLPSLISIGKLLPIEWYNEKKMKVYEAHEIIEIIEMYEFTIACLTKAISFLRSIGNDTAFITKIDEIYNNKFYYTKRYFNLKPEFNTLFSIVRFIDFRNEYFYYGVIDNKDETKNLYEIWNYYYTLVFGESTKFISITDKIIIGRDRENLEAENSFPIKYSKEKPFDYNVLAKLIKIPKNDYVNSTLNLLNTLAENKNYYQKTKLDTALKDVSILKNKMRELKKDEKVRNGTIDYRKELLKSYKDLEPIFKVLKEIENNDEAKNVNASKFYGKNYIIDNEERKIYEWSDYWVVLTILIMIILESNTASKSFWKPFENAFGKERLWDIAKKHLQQNDKPNYTHNIKKAKDIIKKINISLKKSGNQLIKL